MTLIPEWILGIVFQIVGSFFSNLGINVQKFAHVTRERLPPNDPMKTTEYYKTPLWLLGFGLFCLGEVCAGVAMGYSPQSLLAVLSSYSLILNGIFSHVFTGSKITFNYIKSSIIIMIGSILVILSITHHKQEYTIQDLGKLFRSIPFIIFFIFLIIFLIVLFVIRSVIPRNPTLLTTISSFMACLSVLLAKCTMQLVKKSWFDDNPINQWLESIWPWIIPACFIVFASLNVHFLNMAMQTTSTTHVYPLYFSTSTILVILNGMIFFQEYLWFTFLQSIVFSMGVSICLTGITSLQEEDEHEYEILPHGEDSDEDDDDRHSMLKSYPSDFFLRQEIARGRDVESEYSESPSASSEVSAFFGKGVGTKFNNLTHFNSESNRPRLSHQNHQAPMSLCSPEMNETALTTAMSPNGGESSGYPHSNVTHSLQSPQSLHDESLSPSGPSAANSTQSGTASKFPKGHGYNPIFDDGKGGNKAPNQNFTHSGQSSLSVQQQQQPTSVYHDEPSVHIDYHPVLTKPDQQRQQMAMQAASQQAPAVKKHKERVVRQSQGSRLTSFFESQGNM